MFPRGHPTVRRLRLSAILIADDCTLRRRPTDLFGRESVTMGSMTITNRSASALLARVAGAALIAITFISIAKTPFAPRAAAQNAAGYRADSRSADGLYSATFTTPQGVIKVNLPDAMVAGDTVSGSIY